MAGNVNDLEDGGKHYHLHVKVQNALFNLFHLKIHYYPACEADTDVYEISCVTIKT